MIQATTLVNTEFIKSSSNDFWSSIGLSPATLKKGRSTSEIRAAAKKKLTAIGRPQMVGLFAFWKLSSPANVDAEQLAEQMLGFSNLESITCLVEFQKRKSDFVSRAFNRLVPKRKLAGAFETMVANLKPLAQLLILFEQSPDHLKEVFYSHLWESKRTHTDFTSDKLLSSTFLKTIQRKEKELATSLSRCWGRDVRVFGTQRLNNGLTVVAFDREYSPTVRRDFRNKFSLHFRCGDIIFGVSKDRDSIHVKTQNSELTDLVRRFIETEFDVTLTPVQWQAFSGYDPERLKNSLLGEYDEKSDLQVTAVAFRRSTLSSRSPLAVSSGENCLSIRNDLQRLKESGIVTIDSLDDLAHLHVVLRDKVTRIDVQALSGGAVRFALDDSNCTADHTECVKGAFRDAFGIPLNQLIDPGKFALGNVGVISFLLNIQTDHEIQDFQQSEYQRMKKDDLLVEQVKPAKACKRPICSGFRRPVSNPDLKHCAICDGPLEPHQFNEVSKNDAVIRSLVGKKLEEVGWSVGDKRTFEANEYFPITPPGDLAGDPIWLLFRDNLSEKTRQQMERSTHAILLVSSRTAGGHIYIDSIGTGRLNLAYLIATSNDPKQSADFLQLLKQVITDLHRSTAIRISKAAEISFQHLRSGTKGDSGHVYETDVFNLLRSFLPYSYKLGRQGVAEPDGFVCVPTYGQDGKRDIGDGRSWNWTYDAKHSDKSHGYSLDISERRKMVEYVDKIRSKRRFMGEVEKPKAHVIISNNLSDSDMVATAKYFFGSDGVRPSNRDVRLILMREEFLSTLYEAITKHHEAFQRRQPIFGECLVECMSAEGINGYLTLDQTKAESLVNLILEHREIDKTLSRSDVVKGIDAIG